LISIYPYKLASQSARALAMGLSSVLPYRPLLVRPDGRFKPRRDSLVINWGSSTEPNWIFNQGHDLNAPVYIALAANKLDSFKCFTQFNVSHPLWTESKDVAQNWINDGSVVIVRHLLTGHSGQGIEIIQEGEVPTAPLYTKYKKKRAEYRVHVFKGEVIDTCQKKKSTEANNSGSINTFIRNHVNGWVFCRDGIIPSPPREKLAIRAVEALGLDFGAVDIIYNESEDTNYVLEVNTAPGIVGQTLTKYVEAIAKLQQ